MRPLCRLLGISAQGYYKHDYASNEADILSASIVLYCLYVRQKERLPKAGCRELYTLCREYFREKFTIGRDRFYNVLRSNSLMLRRTRYRPRTTDSRHGCLVVADITYIYTREGFAYLSLVTDAYSRYIVGYCLSRSLDAEGPLRAMYMALETYRAYGISTEGMIHHSDRGVQYASKQYTNLLLSQGIRISMTQTGDPLHNALAERMNNTLKNGWLFNEGDMDFRQAEEAVSKSVAMYNNARPHRALGMKTPMEVFSGRGGNPLMEYRYN